MLRSSVPLLFRMRMGGMLVDYKATSRDHKRAIRVEEALVDPQLPVTIMPMGWLEQLRSPSTRLPTGFHTEEAVFAPAGYPGAASASSASHTTNTATSTTATTAITATTTTATTSSANAIRAGPIVLYITGQTAPVVLNPLFVSAETWGSLLVKKTDNNSCSGGGGGGGEQEEWDLRLGMDAIEQCTLYAELRPGGLLYSKLPHKDGDLQAAFEPAQDVLRRYGMKVGLSESPLVPRPWTRMKHMFIDELQRGPKMTEFVGHNPRNGTEWRFSQHNKYFRQGVWRETIRRNEMNEGSHAHSSWQKTPQQAVPEISFLAPFP